MARRIDCNEEGKFNVVLYGDVINPSSDYEYHQVCLSYRELTSLIDNLNAMRQQVYIHEVDVSPDVFNRHSKKRNYVYPGEHHAIQFDILKMKEIANPDEELVKFTGREKRFLIKSIEKGVSSFGEVTFMRIEEI